MMYYTIRESADNVELDIKGDIEIIRFIDGSGSRKEVNIKEILNSLLEKEDEWNNLTPKTKYNEKNDTIDVVFNYSRGVKDKSQKHGIRVEEYPVIVGNVKDIEIKYAEWYREHNQLDEWVKWDKRKYYEKYEFAKDVSGYNLFNEDKKR